METRRVYKYIIVISFVLIIQGLSPGLLHLQVHAQGDNLELVRSYVVDPTTPGEQVDVYEIPLNGGQEIVVEGSLTSNTIWGDDPGVSIFFDERPISDIYLAVYGEEEFYLQVFSSLEDYSMKVVVNYYGYDEKNGLEGIRSYHLNVFMADHFDAGTDHDAGGDFSSTIEITKSSSIVGYVYGDHLFGVGTDVFDFYKIHLEENEKLTIILTHLEAWDRPERSLNLKLYDEYRGHLIEGGDSVFWHFYGVETPVGRSGNITLTSLASQDLYINVGTGAHWSTYRLETFVEKASPPDYFNEAQLYGHYEREYLNSSRDGDDIYPIECTGGQELRIRFTQETGTNWGIGGLYLYDEEGARVAHAELGITNHRWTQYLIFSPCEGREILGIGLWGEILRYEMDVYIADRFDLSSGRDAGDNFESALEVSLGTEDYGFLTLGGTASFPYEGFVEHSCATEGWDRVDFYKIYLQAGQELEVTVDSTDCVEIPVTIYDGNLEWVNEGLFNLTEGQPLTLYWTPEEDQFAYVSLHEHQWRGGYYEISFTEREKQSSSITCTLSSQEIEIEDSVSVSGSISPSVSGVPVIITFTELDGSTFNRTATTDAEGHFSDSYTPSDMGSWSVSASWEGDAYYKGSTSETLTLKVEEPESEREPSIWDSIPGFPWESTILGLIAVIIILWYARTRKF